MGEGKNRGDSDIAKAESTGEDPGATGDLICNLPHRALGSIKHSNTK